MEQKDLKATELDKMTCSYDLQMLKAALAYFPPQPKRFLSIFVKMQELKNTFRLISSPENINSLNICSTPEDSPKQGFFDIWNEIKDYGGPEQQKMFEQLNKLIRLSSMYEQMAQSAAGETGTSDPYSAKSGQPKWQESAPVPFHAKEKTEPDPNEIQAPTPRKDESVEEPFSELAAASLSRQTDDSAFSHSPESARKPDFRTYIRNSLSPENQALFDSYSAMFHSSDAFSGKEN